MQVWNQQAMLWNQQAMLTMIHQPQPKPVQVRSPPPTQPKLFHTHATTDRKVHFRHSLTILHLARSSAQIEYVILQLSNDWYWQTDSEKYCADLNSHVTYTISDYNSIFNLSFWISISGAWSQITFKQHRAKIYSSFGQVKAELPELHWKHES